MIRRKLFFLLMLAAGAMALFAQLNQTIINLPADTWYKIPNSKMRPVCDPGAGTYGCWSVIATWSGGAYNNDLNEMIIWGGGHNDYYGNEVYSFSFDSLKWKRWTNASPYNSSSACGVNILSDGRPNSRHTYNGLAYISHAHRFFGLGGALACAAGGCGANELFTFEFGGKQWYRMQPSGTKPSTGCGDNSAYDPVSKKVYYHTGSGFFAYDFTANSWTQPSNNTNAYYRTTCIDTKRRKIVEVGNGGISVYDLNSPTLASTNFPTTGGATILAISNPGLDYDPVADRVVGWAGGAVYSLDMDTKVWTAKSSSGAPTPTTGSYYLGIYGRWRYIPPLNAFALVDDVDSNVYIYKNTSGSAIEKQRSPLSSANLSVSPNPFHQKAVIALTRLAKGTFGHASLLVYDMQGKMVEDLTSRIADNEVAWDAKNACGGIYLAVLKSEGRTLSTKCLLIK